MSAAYLIKLYRNGSILNRRSLKLTPSLSGKVTLYDIPSHNCVRQKHNQSPNWERLLKEGFISKQKNPGKEMSSYAEACSSQYQSPSYFPGDDMLERRWELLKPYRCKSRNLLPFTFASYNVLAQNLLEDHVNLYTYCAPAYLDWRYRKLNLCAEIVHMMPDILCMQEVDEAHFDDCYLQALEPIGYKGEYIKRSGNKHDGCATFYRTNKFKLDKVEKVEYLKPGVSVLDRDNVGLILLLKPVYGPADARICVANTHLLFNPKRGDIKLAQLQVLLSEIDKLAYISQPTKVGNEFPDPIYHPVLLCGDFNAVPLSALYKFVVNGELNYDGIPLKSVSGQEKYPAQHPTMQRVILPTSLDIIDQCQFVTEFSRRQSEMTLSHVDTEEIEELRRSTESKGKDRLRSQPSRISNQKRASHRSASPSQSKRKCNTENETTTDQWRSVSTDSYTKLERTNVEASSYVNHKKPVILSAEGVGTKRVDPHEVVIPAEEVESSVSTPEVVIPQEAIESASQRKISHMSARHWHKENASFEKQNDPCTSAEKGALKYCSQGCGTLSHRLRFRSTYDHQRRRPGDCFESPEITTCHGRAQHTVDYIFYSPGGRLDDCYALELKRRLQLYTKDDMVDIGALPNKYISSDHTILMAEFEWDQSMYINHDSEDN